MHEVLLAQRAQEELEDAHQWWAENRSSEQADRWYTGFVRAMLALENNPERCLLAPEGELFPMEIRQLNFGLANKPTHRALYTVRPDAVVILRVRHLAQQPMSSDDF
jgi:plasmid stabilization system protein ParE